MIRIVHLEVRLRDIILTRMRRSDPETYELMRPKRRGTLISDSVDPIGPREKEKRAISEVLLD